ncbi:MAG: HetZ-related protein 2 [Elainellaceae cyanobacterium]
MMMIAVEDLKQQWQSRLQSELPSQSVAHRESIIAWLLGNAAHRGADSSASPPKDIPSQTPQHVLQQAMDYRYRILCKRYLNVPQSRAYRQLINRLSSIFVLRNKVRTWISLSRDRRRSVVDVLQEVIQEMIRSDRHIQHQLRLISQCTPDPRLRNALMLTSIEEYCLRPIRNQPLLVYRFVNYLRRSQRGGMTQVPTQDIVRLISEEQVFDDGDNPVSLLDGEAIAQYQDSQFWQEQQTLRHSVKLEFVAYLQQTLGEEAITWLQLHLQGHTQEIIAQQMDLPISRVYRLREKVSYHAVRVFSTKRQSELVTTWLGISLKEHDFGLTLEQWEQFLDRITPAQRLLVSDLKAGKTFDAIAQERNITVAQCLSEWSKLYLIAQDLRTA